MKEENTENRLELNNINLIYHSLKEETLAVKDLSLNIKKGEFISVVGPSGCGKSSLLSIIGGLLKPSSGSFNVNGNIGYMLQKDIYVIIGLIFSN